MTQEINAEPTKEFFVDMFVRDIPLEQAVLDLVDNSVDGAKRFQTAGSQRFDGRSITIEISSTSFRITDNSGGFSTAIARDYAFRFGRPKNTPATSHSIGQFGVGMKRALFKFGKHFIVRSATSDEEWAIDINVPEWVAKEDTWIFPWANYPAENSISRSNPGTEIIVSDLREEVALRFSTQRFVNEIFELIKSKHRQFIAEGLRISVNGKHIDATNLYLLIQDGFAPGVDNISFQEDKKADVSVRIVVGVGASAPREAGWYVICNGRIVLEADRRPQTGWGFLEENAARVIVPSFHNQFARFRGIVSFDSEDSARVPWNTTKTDIDPDNPIWRKTFERMLEMMRPVIDFLNDLDKDIDEYTRDQSPLLDFVQKSTSTKADSLVAKSEFRAPQRDQVKKAVRTVKIQYSRPLADVEFLQNALSVSSAKAVGEKTFDLTLKKQKSE